MRSHGPALLAFALLAMAVSAPAAAQAPAAQAPAAAPGVVIGRANVLDGDQIAINRQRFRIFGIDAIEHHQNCYIDGKAWGCGAVATRRLEDLVALGQVTCRDAGLPAEAQAVWAECKVGNDDIGEVMVRSGFALANRDQTDRYVPLEAAAKAANLQIWKSAFVEPWVFRADLRAIEERISSRLLALIQRDVERVLTEGQGGLPVFQGFKIGRTDKPTPEVEFAAADIGRNFISRAVPNDHAFAWQDVAFEPIRWRQTVMLQAHAYALNKIWAGLGQLPQRAVTTNDALAFLTEITEQSKPWVQAGRQPVLLVRAGTDPPWIGEWFGGAPMPGLKLSRKDAIRSEIYMGTINGVDVYRGDLAEGESLLFPADLLLEVNYRPDAGGRLVAIDHQPGGETEPGAVFLRFAQELVWKPDVVISLRYPYRPPAPEYE